jgi:hypothetical protein
VGHHSAPRDAGKAAHRSNSNRPLVTIMLPLFAVMVEIGRVSLWAGLDEGRICERVSMSRITCDS